MAALKKRIPASTVVEAIVASILFMVVFFISLETITRIGTMERDDALLLAEIDGKACVHEFQTGHYANGTYTRDYAWGEITITITPYEERSDIRELHFETRIKPGNRSMIYRILAPCLP